MEMLQFVYIMWCPVNHDVRSLEFGCCFVVFCVSQYVLDLVHLLADLQLGGAFGFVDRVGIAFSAVL